MKAKQTISDSSKAKRKELIEKVAAKFSNQVIFKDKVENAKKYLKQVTFDPKNTTI